MFGMDMRLGDIFRRQSDRRAVSPDVDRAHGPWPDEVDVERRADFEARMVPGQSDDPGEGREALGIDPDLASIESLIEDGEFEVGESSRTIFGHMLRVGEARPLVDGEGA